MYNREAVRQSLNGNDNIRAFTIAMAIPAAAFRWRKAYENELLRVIRLKQPMSLFRRSGLLVEAGVA